MGGSPKVVVLGAGPGGLAAAYALARAGLRPLVLERAPVPGGLMRGVRHGEFQVDLGRKELYDRIPEVTRLWETLLGDELVPYPHRVGILYDRVIIERERTYRGVLRGLPARFVARGAHDFLRARVRRAKSGAPPANLEEYWQDRRGEFLTRALSQGFQEKFSGIPFRERPIPWDAEGSDAEARDASTVRAAKALASRLRSSPPRQVVFRHPRKGTEQIVDALVNEIVACGGRFLHGAEVTSVEHAGGRARSVDVLARGKRRRVAVDTLVSGMPMLALARALGFVDESLKRADWNRRRFTYLGYFFLDAPPRFPHAWLEVSCPRLAVGRVTSFGAFGGAMVPPGKGALSAELYLHDLDPRCAATDDDVLDEIQHELVDAGLIAGGEVRGRKLIRIAGAEASNDYRSWADPAIVALDEAIFGLENLYDVNRAGIDVATLAGLAAARAIVSGDRARFRAVADPKVPYTDYERLG